MAFVLVVEGLGGAGQDAGVGDGRAGVVRAWRQGRGGGVEAGAGLQPSRRCCW